jgi:asparagine synthase (glutamine-hydrolysing)
MINLRSVETAIASLSLSPLAKRLRKDRMTYLSPQKLQRLEQALRRVRDSGIVGDYLEFGVALGGSSILIASAALKNSVSFTGFDVFATIPPPTSDKDDDKSKNRYKSISEGKAKGIGGDDDYYGYRSDLYGDVVRSFEKHGLTVDGEKISLIKGLFEESWPKRKSNPIAFAHIDCDWYDPVNFCLNAIAPHLEVGGVAILDDYHDYGGCKMATDEFLRSHPNFAMEDGPNLIIVRRQ